MNDAALSVDVVLCGVLKSFIAVLSASGTYSFTIARSHSVNSDNWNVSERVFIRRRNERRMHLYLYRHDGLHSLC
jgi:hypothetical protein